MNNMKNTQSTHCGDDFEAGALSVEDAQNKIISTINPAAGKEKIALRDCLGRYLAEDIISPINVPSHTNSAMDGYALAGADLPVDADNEYQVVDTSYAGTPSSVAYQAGQVIRIMTGGVMPAGTDTVIMQEQVENTRENAIRIQGIGTHKTGQNVRYPGEDIAQGSTVLAKSRQVTPADLGIIASFGLSELSVFRRPRVAFFSTGNELRSIGETLGEGEIYDSNRYTLFGMLKKMDVEILDMGVIEDSKDAIRNAFIEAADMADFVITSGGVSVGEADYIKPVLKELGETHFWKIRMKPGRPLTFGSLNQIADHQPSRPAYFFGLPGNPVAVMVTFLQFVQPAIRYFASGKSHTPIALQAQSTGKLYKRPGRTEFQRGILEQGDNGELTVKRTGKQGSGILTSMSLANCFMLLDEKSTGCEAGDMLTVLPFDCEM
jgi:molybdopterin molybdotransferase